MTADERQQLKIRVDQALREKHRIRGEKHRCVGCGCSWSTFTFACRSCMSRRWHRQQRAA